MNNKKINIMSKIIDMTRHYLYIITYVFAIIVYSINYCFPLYILKKIKLFNKVSTTLLNHMLMKFQSIIKCSLFIGGTDLFVYKKKNKELIYKNNVIIIPNHLSELDSMYLGTLYADVFPEYYKIITFAKNTIRFYPFIGWITLAYNTIFVQNRNTSPNVNQYRYIEDKLKEENNNDYKKNIIIFIEGTTFCRKVKERREFFNNSINYNNVLIPKTTGLHMIHSNVDIDGETYLTLKFEGNYNIEEYTMMGLLKGIKPSSVHMIIDTKPYNKDIHLLNNRDKYNDMVYEKFRSIDKKLDDNIDVWKKKYDCEKLSLNFSDILCFMLFLISGYYMVNGLFDSSVYRWYVCIVTIMYLVFGCKEI